MPLDPLLEDSSLEDLWLEDLWLEDPLRVMSGIRSPRRRRAASGGCW